MSTSLCFNEITLSPVTYQNGIWIRAAELARALGYSSEEKVSRVYRRNEDEFTPDMTQVIEILDRPSSGLSENLTTKARIFSLRGCHLLAMFARTPVAKAFRRWVLDVLDNLAKQEQARVDEEVKPLSDAPLTPDQQCTLQAIVRAKVEAIPVAERGKGLYPQLWSRFNNHFRIAKYAQLPKAA